MNKHLRRLRRLLPVLLLLLLASALYLSVYYRAEPAAEAALRSDPAVAVSETDYGWFFDGPSDSEALIFYPGAKVEETAYAPLLRRLAAEEMDVLLVKMPFHMAFFGTERAADLQARYAYAHWFIGGHSLGGAVAALYASAHPDALDGLILLAAYPSRPLPPELLELQLYGSEDRVLNRRRLAAAEVNDSDALRVHVIEGGNHAQFGCYGPQSGDGAAAIPAEAQQEETVQTIAAAVRERLA